MSVNAAEQKLPVAVEGVVTDLGAWPYGITVQDGNDGMFIALDPGAPRLKVGQRVVSHGYTDPGRFAPIVIAGRIDVIGSATLPEPYRANARELASGELDNRRVEIRGVVRATAQGSLGDGRRMFMVVDMNPGIVHVAVARGIRIDVTRFVDASIRAAGVVAVEFNTRRQALGGSVIVNRLEDISVVRGPSTNALSGTLTPIDRIFTWGAHQDWSHRVKVRGALTLQRRGEYLILQNGDQAIRVNSLEAEPLKPGVPCEASGFAVPEFFGPTLADAVVQCESNPVVVKPMQREASKISPGDDNWLLTSLRGRLIDVQESRNGISLSLEDHGVRFTADAPASVAKEMDKISVGAQLQVTGINEVLVDTLRRSKGFRLLIRSAKDVVVVGGGPLLSSNEILWSALGLGLAALLCGLWALMLRSRVRSQTAWISESLRREKADAWLHAERSRILGLIGRNAPLPRVCEALVDVIDTGCESSHAAIGIYSGGEWEWMGSTCEIHSEAESFEIESSSGALRARVPATPGSTLARAELFNVCRECISIALEQRDLHERLVQQSLSDPLTQLPNRRSLDHHLEAVLAGAEKESSRPAVLVIDMDGFKAINDTLGHSAGDLVLQNLAQRFRSVIRGTDMIARVGGDEFVAVLADVTDVREAEAIAERLASEAACPIEVSDIAIRPALSIGIAVYPADGSSAHALKCAADVRMYQSKMTRSKSSEAQCPAFVSAPLETWDTVVTH